MDTGRVGSMIANELQLKVTRRKLQSLREALQQLDTRADEACEYCP